MSLVLSCPEWKKRRKGWLKKKILFIKNPSVLNEFFSINQSWERLH